MSKIALSITVFVANVATGALLAIGCEWPPPPVTPKPEPTVTPAESWCDAACARWQAAGCKEGADVCDAFGADGECSRSVSCLAACEREPHAYPTGRCVASPAVSTQPFQTCEQIRTVCGTP